MNSSTLVLPDTAIETRSTPRHFRLRACCWAVALALGGAQSWATRFTMNPDGISYLDIGDAYWRHDWHNAINAYWSPLYSWIVGFFVNVLKPSPYWEYPLVRLVNFSIYVVALMCFEYFLSIFIADRVHQTAGRSGLDESSWRLLGYGLFVSSSLILVGTGPVTPDMLVVAFFYLASALLLQVKGQKAPMAAYAAFGIVLGVAYLAKAVMFPLAFVFLTVAAFYSGCDSRRLRRLGISALLFFAISAPLITAISLQKNRLTFGEAASWTYGFYVNDAPYWVGNSPRLKHPMHLLSTAAPVYEFGDQVGGTFPPWYDPSYWSEGIRLHFTIRGEFRPLLGAAEEFGIIFFIVFLNVTIGAIVLHAWFAKVPRCEYTWAIAIPALASFLLYALVHIEWRFVGAQATILFLFVFSGIAFPDRARARRQGWSMVVAIVFISGLVVGLVVLNSITSSIGPVYADAAAALSGIGLRPGDRVGLVWNEQWFVGATEGGFVPRLLRLKITAEETEADAFWRMPEAEAAKTLDSMRKGGVRTVLALDVPAAAKPGWQRLGMTRYYAYVFTSNKE
jgi:4-amino-4-deoxy-L-arabinose transferase-like glycosyltransferase